MIRGRNIRGQALLELAIFGSLILVIFGILLSYLSRANDLQYVQMRTFREALQIANYGGINTPSAGGGSVQLSLLENRRDADISGYFRKGSSQTTNANASVLWSVPEVGSAGESANYYKVNDNYSPNLKDIGSVQNVTTSQDTQFKESTRKQEDAAGITNIRSSTLKDTITTTLVDKDNKPLWTVTQGVYYDPNTHQYRYSEAATGTEVERGRTWYTPGH
ncbi:MAG: hypothetical protein NT088_02775 [Candidatus Omnitrophica bacterium]|nr:hypothetical protein [Candidatus Omnitrophota bacterium]